MYRILKSNLPRLFAAIAAQNDLFLPVRTAGKTNFALWNDAAEVDLDTLKTVKSPKDAFFPQSENLYTCGKVDGKTSITPEARCSAPFVVFGAMIMAFTMSLDDFVISYFVTGSEFVTLPVKIYSLTRKQIHPKIYAMFTLLFLLIFVLMVIMNLLQLKGDKKQAKRGGAA